MVSTDTPQVLSGWLRCCPIAGKPGSWSSSAPSADGLGAPSAQLDDRGSGSRSSVSFGFTEGAFAVEPSADTVWILR
jgi:hypothetical protein